MSGIHGLLRFDTAAVRRADLERQARALAHRGRDGARLWIGGPAGLGHLLLRVTDEDFQERQPLIDGPVTLVADLRLDNRDALAAALGVATQDLAGMADSALLLRAYRHWGEDCARHLIGDFAFAIWDGRIQTLLLARDHLGQRQIFYHRAAEFFVFASEPRALWALPDVPHALSPIALGARMILSPRDRQGETQFEGIKGVEGGMLLKVHADGRIESMRYWSPAPAPEHLGKDEAYYIEAYRRVLGEAVACRVRRNAGASGLLLGGGFDSGSIAGLAGPAMRAAGRRLKAISSVMPEGDRTTPRNPRRWVEYLARDMPHLEVRYHTREGTDLYSGLEASFPTADGIRGPNRYVQDEMMRQLAAAGAKIVMTGDGGDSSLNPRARRALLRLLRRGALRRFLRELKASTKRRRFMPLLLDEVLLPLLPARLYRAIGRWRQGLPLSGPAMPVAAALMEQLAASGIGLPDYRPENRLEDLRTIFTRAAARLQAAPVMGGALPAAQHGLTMTLPFRDKRVVELALAIPEELVFRDGRDRYLARKALAEVLPPELLKRGSDNDEVAPDLPEMIRRIAPRLLADIDRMDKDGRLKPYFDFARMRAMLSAGSAAAREHAARSFQHARFVEWFERDNYGGDGS